MIIVYFKENCTGLKGNSEFLPKREEYLLPTFWLKKVLPSYSKPVPTGLDPIPDHTAGRWTGASHFGRRFSDR